MIVGIDSGNTAGVACLSLEGQLLFVGHRRNADFNWMVSSISEAGIPIIIATDKKVAGASVRKAGAAFNSRVFAPHGDLTIDEKNKIAKAEGITDPHERDAYAAAIKAYNAHANKLKQAMHLARLKSADADDIMAKVVRKHSIDEAIHNRKSGRK